MVAKPLPGTNATGYRVSRKVRPDGESPVGSREQLEAQLCTKLCVFSLGKRPAGTHDNLFQIHTRLPQTGREYISLTHGDWNKMLPAQIATRAIQDRHSGTFSQCENG